MPLTLSVQSFRRLDGTSVISQVLAGDETGNPFDYPSFSADGRYVAFQTAANLTSGDVEFVDVFRMDLATGALVKISTAADGTGGNQNSTSVQLSADGRYAVFASHATNLGSGGPTSSDIFWKDLVTGEVRLVSSAQWTGADGNSYAPQISADGRYVLFESSATNLVPGDPASQDIFLKDVVTNAIVRVSASASGEGGNASSFNAQFTPDGRFVVFESRADNLVAGDTNGDLDVFVKDLTTGAISRASTDANGGEGDGDSLNARISADGRYVFFQSDAALVPGDTGTFDIFRKDLTDGSIVKVSASANGEGGNGNSFFASVSADGRYVTFTSQATNLVPGDPSGFPGDVFLKDLQTGAIARLSVRADGSEGDGNPGLDLRSQISADGRYVAFQSSSRLVPGDEDFASDIFLVDAAYLPHRQAIVEGRYVEAKLGVGAASRVSIAWGDGTASTVTPSLGSASFSHIYASSGTKAALVTVKQGAQTWVVPYKVDLAAGTLARNTALIDTLSGGAAADALTGDAFANRLYGNSGSDRLYGRSGNDTLAGGLGHDRLYGEAGNDTLDGGYG
ncbi:hypothetical protein GR328_20975, partial [Microvirga makkahensis]|nr:hypothetical protein [Microvirga makkahensis]